MKAILPHVVFDGWGGIAFAAAVEESSVPPKLAGATCPRGATDLAVFNHKKGDADFEGAFNSVQSDTLRYSEKVALAVRLRLDLSGDREVVRRASALFALPHMAVEGAGLIWGTADRIWNVLGDTSDDINWYSKRAILSGVYASSVLFWLGDSGNGKATQAFVDRRIADVMEFEKFKKNAQGSAVLGPFARAFGSATQSVRKPQGQALRPLPGTMKPQDTR